MPTAAASTGDVPRPEATLYWNEHGEVACLIHVPTPGSVARETGGWMPFSVGELRAWIAADGAAPKCPGCEPKKGLVHIGGPHWRCVFCQGTVCAGCECCEPPACNCRLVRA